MKHLIILLITFFMCGVSFAECSKEYCPPKVHHDHEVHHDHNQVTNGVDGSNGINGTNGINGSLFNDSSLTRAISINAALSNIPALSHVDDHTHTGFGAAVGNYSNQSSVAVGFVHQRGKMAYKASYGVSGSQKILGTGVSVTW